MPLFATRILVTIVFVHRRKILPNLGVHGTKRNMRNWPRTEPGKKTRRNMSEDLKAEEGNC
jgi:hypothetical protein